MSPAWKNLGELRAMLSTWRGWYQRGWTDAQVTAAIHGRMAPGPSLVERVRALRGAP